MVGMILFINYRHEVDSHQQLLITTQQMAVASILDSYQQMIEVIFEERFNTPQVISLIAQARHANESQLAQIRGKLYRHFFSTYENLHNKDIRTLQFVLSNGKSFLRFNRPDLFGDTISDDRPLLKKALTGKAQGGILENGRIYPCYRYAFPLVSDGDVVGIVDFGISFEAVRHSLFRVNQVTGSHYSFIIKRDLLESISHPSSHNLYRNSTISDGYLIEHHLYSHLSNDIEAIDLALQNNQPIQQALDNGTSSATEICLNGKGCYSISLQPVLDSNQRIAGYIINYTPMEDFHYLRQSHFSAFLLGGLFLLMAGFALYRWLQSNQRLRTISDHMAEGMYVMDPSGSILYVNPTACQLLKYSKQDLLGQDAHSLLHCDSNGHPLPHQACSIRQNTLNGINYKSDDELFRCRDGKIIRTSVVSSPFWSNDRLSGSVVLFRDINTEYEVKQRLLRSDVAFSSLAEGVMVTDDKGRIQAVNRAFSVITGYPERDVLGENPRILKSGQHDDTFYQALWYQVIHTGGWEGEIWNRRKNGEIYPEFLRITSVKDSNGQITEYVATFSDITEKRQHEQQLQKLAYNDTLTDLHNRTAFLEMFERALARSQRRETRCALLYLDLDRFKKINDTLGHVVGDEVLVETAARLQQAIRNEDEVARLGGDEFIVMLEDVPDSDAPARVARKILSLLMQPILSEPHMLHITASIGIAIFPEDGRDATTLLKNADAAMYMAKHEGRNNFHYFTQAMAEKEEDRFKLEIDLHTALLNDEFSLYYQPKINLGSGEVTGIEALLRWQHPQRGLLTASEFLSVAHDAGVMRDITNWVITESCTQLQAWLDAGLQPGRIAINIDAHTFNSSDAYDQIGRTVQITGISPHLVELEIPESGLLEKAFDDVFWRQMVDLGFILTIDDFGTGESSLFRLKHLPVNMLKIDKSFIRDIESDADDRAIIHTVIAMGKSLGLVVLAEGVENHRQLCFLQEMGCDQVQGHLISEPQSAQMVSELLSQKPYKTLLDPKTTERC